VLARRSAKGRAALAAFDKDKKMDDGDDDDKLSYTEDESLPLETLLRAQGAKFDEIASAIAERIFHSTGLPVRRTASKNI
jgi:hypothetical protein